MRYTEQFKKQVVKKVLSPGVYMVNVAEKLKISQSAIQSWKKLYSDEVKAEIVQIDIEKLLHEEAIDIDKMMLDAEPEEQRPELEVLDKIEKGRPASQYKTLEKYVILKHLKRLSGEAQGIFLRSYGLQSRHIDLWGDEIMAMGEKQLEKDLARFRSLVYGFYGKKNQLVRDFGMMPFKDAQGKPKKTAAKA